jgi:hypothetical protein
MSNAEMRPESLNDYLLHQLAELDIDDRVEQFAERIISTLDARDGGYLRMPLVDLLPPNHAPDDLAIAEEALKVVQSLDPPGIAARDLRECLMNQLTPDLRYYEEMATMINYHLEDLAENRLPVIQRKTSYSIETIKAVKEELHQLNPKPAAGFMKAYVPNVTPDVILDQDEDVSLRGLGTLAGDDRARDRHDRRHAVARPSDRAAGRRGHGQVVEGHRLLQARRCAHPPVSGRRRQHKIQNPVEPAAAFTAEAAHRPETLWLFLLACLQ